MKMFQRGECLQCHNAIWFWQTAVPIENEVCHANCVAARRMITARQERSIEQAIRDEFDRFDDVYWRGEKNRLIRQRNNRLCESIVQVVWVETHSTE